MVIIGAGPAGISMAVEAIEVGISTEDILVLEKEEVHSWAIRKFYPEQKVVAANYKGKEAICYGVMCLTDMSKTETISYLDKAIKDYRIDVQYRESVFGIKKTPEGFIISTSKMSYRSDLCVIAIGIFGKPKKPDYQIPRELKDKAHFDVTSQKIENQSILIVGGGDSASEYAQYLVQMGNQVSLSYRRKTFQRMNEVNKKSLLALSEEKKVQLYLESNIEKIVPHDQGIEVCFQEKEQKNIFCDHIVYALGGSTPRNFLQYVGVSYDGEEPHIGEGYETNVPGLFVIGDLSSGKKGGSIISAFNSSKQAMVKICKEYLS